MDLPDFLSLDADGDIRLTGSRIGLYHVVREYQDGATAGMIAEEFPTVPLAQVERVIGFYLANRAPVDEYVRGYEAELDRQQAAAPRPDWDRMRARLAAIKQARQAGGG